MQEHSQSTNTRQADKNKRKKQTEDSGKKNERMYQADVEASEEGGIALFHSLQAEQQGGSMRHAAYKCPH